MNAISSMLGKKMNGFSPRFSVDLGNNCNKLILNDILCQLTSMQFAGYIRAVVVMESIKHDQASDLY